VTPGRWRPPQKANPELVHEHSGLLSVDDAGWHAVVCACGWSAAPFLCQEDAMDAYGDHRTDVVNKGET
jgi:hypothetical protein